MKFLVYIFLFLFSEALVAQKQSDTIQANYIGGVKDLIVYLRKNLKDTKSFPDSKNPNLSGKMIVALIKLDEKDKVNDVTYANLENHYQGNTVDVSFKDELRDVLKKSNKWKSKSFQGKSYSSKMMYIFKFWNDSIDITPYPLKYEGEYFESNFGVTNEKGKQSVTIEGEGEQIIMLNNAPVVEEKAKEEVYAVVEEMPEYPGGRAEMMKFIDKTTKYPKKEKKEKIGGSVFLKFIVQNSGKIANVQVLKSSGNANLDKEALRIISLMPNWKPGKQNGRPVPVYFNLPIKFNPD